VKPKKVYRVGVRKGLGIDGPVLGSQACGTDAGLAQRQEGEAVIGYREDQPVSEAGRSAQSASAMIKPSNSPPSVETEEP
jgi:hypothetical protein